MIELYEYKICSEPSFCFHCGWSIEIGDDIHIQKPSELIFCSMECVVFHEHCFKGNNNVQIPSGSKNNK